MVTSVLGVMFQVMGIDSAVNTVARILGPIVFGLLYGRFDAEVCLRPSHVAVTDNDNIRHALGDQSNHCACLSAFMEL